MAARTRQLVVLVLLGAAAFVAVRWWSHRGAGSIDAAAWPPLIVPDEAAPAPARGLVADAAAAAAAAADDADAGGPTAPRWVLPLDDGGCPNGYPVKANDNSGIFHVPGGRFYERTKPERCYAEAVDAAADGYRPAKA